MSPFEITRSVTMINAELVNRPGELGVVAPDARADLIAVEGNPLADISLLDGQGEHLIHIMRDRCSLSRCSRFRFSRSHRSGSIRTAPSGHR